MEKVAAIDSTGWWTQQASDDASIWVLSSFTEDAAGANVSDKGSAHLYAVSAHGANVDEIGIAVLDGNLLGTASLSGLGSGNGGSAAFSMRANRYQQSPYQTQSGFQFRARLGNGVPQIVKPSPRREWYVEQAQNSGPQALAASATMTWGFTRTPRRTPTLYLLDYGAKALAGTAGTAKIEVWDATKGTKLFEWAGQSMRYDGKADTDEYFGPYACTSGDQIEFRVTNTGTAQVTAAANVVFAWGF